MVSNKPNAANEEQIFPLSPEQKRDYEFWVKFDWPGVADLVLDEPEPPGSKRRPNAASALQQDRCGEQFEDFRIVTESIRKGIPVAVKVLDAAGRLLHQST